ncbi:MAG: hypothetical protein FJX03_07490 [Alphaproteobacteria bacterium]|nr:hypothetical protein [Alphaproteobacteria bacterium]
MFKLIVNAIDLHRGSSISHDFDAKPAPLTSPLQKTFLTDFQSFSENLYVFRAQDFDLQLTCEMTLELKEALTCSPEEGDEGEYLMPILSCNFPRIDTRRFNEKVCWDEYLQGMLMVQFQLKVLEQLFLFCEEKGAVNLMLTFNETNLDYLEIFQRFIISEEQVTIAEDELTIVGIPTHVENYDAVVDFMDDLDKNLYQTMWRDQKVNPAFRNYLIEHSLLVR